MDSSVGDNPPRISPFASAYPGATIIKLHEKKWGGVGVQLKEQRFSTPFQADLQSQFSRFSIVLDLAGGPPEARESRSRPTTFDGGTVHQMNYAPAGCPVWACSENTKYFRTMSLFFRGEEIDSLHDDEIRRSSIDIPKLMFFDPALFHIARLLEIECESVKIIDDLYVETLTLAFLLRLSGLGHPTDGPRTRGGLTAYQLRQVTDYLSDHLAEGATLQDLARMTGLSRSYFSRAFRESTGMPAHQWLLQKRIQKSKEYLLCAELSVAQIALAVGFSDQAHYSKVFSRLVGTSPASWRRTRAR